MDEPLNRLRSALGDRYRIERELGQGGMATVYLATDLRQGRAVALKVMRPELASLIGPERFLREIEISAKLTHPHIVPLYDAGDAGGLPYFVMPFIEGESLRDRLKREQQLSLPDALQITREVADALAYAHGLGLIHRDIKPENIMLSRGHALVADFGIARAVTAAGQGDKLTGTGMAIGTVDYMSPEQATGSGEVDARSDQYSLGCVLYEMLAGGPPFAAPTSQGVLARHLVDPVPSLRTLRNTVPVPVEAAIFSALAKAKADRFPSVTAFVEALDGKRPSPGQPYPAAVARRRPVWKELVATTVVLGLTGLGAWLFLRPPPVNEHRVVVGLFQDRTGDAALAGLASQAATEVTSGLARTGLVEVVDARSSSSDLASATDLVALQKTARQRGAGSIVWGSYSKVGDSLLFQVQMADAATGTVLRPLRPVAGLAAAPAAVVVLLAERVMAGYAAHFDPRLRNYSAMSQPGSYEAWKEFDAGWTAAQANDSAAPASVAHMDRATQLDPQFVLAQVFNVGTIGGSLRDCPRADSLAGALGRSSSRLAVGDEALLKLQVTHCHQDQQAVYDATTILLRVAPGVSGWVLNRVLALMALHSPLEALALLESADQLRRERPTEWNNARMLLLHLLGRYQEALRATAEWRTVSPDDAFLDREEMRQLIGLGQVDSVERMLEARLGKTNRFSAAGGDLFAVGLELKAHGYAEAGSRACGRAMDWFATRPSGAVARITVAQTLSCAGRWNEARQAYQELLATDSLNLYFRSNAGATAYMAGDRPAAEAADQFLARYDRNSQAVYGRAVLAALRGDLDAAMRYLLWAWDNGITWQRVHRDEHLASLRADSRFQAMLKPTR